MKTEKRVIKFRAWDTVSSGMLDWKELLKNDVRRIFASASEDTNVKLMQFTGLLDKNGKEIYEGDVIAWDFEYDSDYDGDMPIVKRTAGRSVVKDIFDQSDYRFAKNEGNGVTVIGNIYENPELTNHA